MIQITTFAQIKFFKGSYEDAIQKAKTEHKSIFIDCYTSWCGPCKLLDQNTFSDPELGKIFNEKYICLKMDMEGNGSFIADRFQINSYPTMLWLSPEETIEKRLSGYHTASDILARLGVTSSDPKIDIGTLPIYQKKYDKGHRDTLFLQNYITLLSQSKKPFEAKLREYLELYPIEQYHEAQWKWLFDIPSYYNSIATQHLISFKKSVLKFKSESEYESRIQSIIEQSALEIGTQKDLLSYSDLKNFIGHSKLNDTKKLEILADIKYAEGSMNMEQYCEYMWKYVDKYDAKNAYSIGKELLTKIPNDKSLTYIEKIVSKSNEDYFQKLLLAKIYRLQRNIKKATTTIEEAIAIGKKNNNDTSEAQKLLIELGN